MKQKLRFGPVGNTEKKLGRLWATFDGGLRVFTAKKTIQNFFENIVASELESEGEKKT